MIHIGFTGTQSGMTLAQKESLWTLVQHRAFYAHHGDCVGADAEFDYIVRRAPNLYGVIMHPCNITSKRAHCVAQYPRDVVREAKDPLARNDDIVEESACLIVASKTMSPTLRSGTWATARRALKLNRPIAVLWPNGAVAYDGDMSFRWQP